jgi:DNA-binding Xre family transcriptional regulator
MNSLETLAKEIQLEIPAAKIDIDKPQANSGIWYMDVTLNDHSVTISWQPDRLFGLATPESVVYGEKAHELYSERLSAAQRVLQLLRSGQKTSGTRIVKFKDMRPARGVTQQTLAKKLRMEQGSLSKFEKRKNVQIRTLRKVIDALGGELEIYARFPDESFRVILPEEKKQRKRKASVKAKQSAGTGK